MRRFIRHPSSIPISCAVQGGPSGLPQQLENISEGGVCFHSEEALDPGLQVRLTIPVHGRDFHAEGVVTWCQSEEKGYQVGVRFNDSATAYTVRMVEQVCHIEDYRQQAAQREGRHLTAAEAASEWVIRYAEKFPH